MVATLSTFSCCTAIQQVGGSRAIAAGSTFYPKSISTIVLSVLLLLLTTLSVSADKLTTENTPVLPAASGLKVSQFDQIENGFDEVYGSLTLLWKIINQGSVRDEQLHGAIILNATAIDPKYAKSSVPNGWAAIGFGDCMLTSDIIMVHALPSGVGAEVIYKLPTFYYQTPTLNPGPSISAVTNNSLVTYQGNGLIIGEFIRFTQPSTGDDSHKAIVVGDTTEFVWSFNVNPVPTPRQSFGVWHGFQNRGRYRIQLTTGTAGPQPIYLSGKGIHGAIMGFSWMLLFPFAVYWARFGKSMPRLNKGWMWVHITVQFIGSGASIGGIVFILSQMSALSNMGSSANFNFVLRPHAIIGYSVLALIVLQLILGPVNRLTLQVEFLHPYRNLLRFLHHTVGRLMLPLAGAQVGLGLNTLFPLQDATYDGRGGIIWWILYFTFLGLWGILFAGTELYYIIRVRNSESGFVSKSTGIAYQRLAGSSQPPSSQERNSSLQTYHKRGFGVVGQTRPVGQRDQGLKPENQIKQAQSHVIAQLTGGGNSRNKQDTAASSAVAAATAGNKLFSWEAIDKAQANGQLYVVAKGRYVYDINQWIYSHPGGQIVLNQVAGTDITNDYFHEAGFDAAAFVPKMIRAFSTSRRILPTTPANQPATPGLLAPGRPVPPQRFSSSGGVLLGGKPRPSGPPPRPSTALPEFRPGMPPLSETEWKFVLKARRTNVHSRLAIEKLSSLCVGQIEGTEMMSPDADAGFNPYEYRRYALIENTVLKGPKTSNPVHKLRLCVLFPHDIRTSEPVQFLPGHCVEIQMKNPSTKQVVSRYFTPISGSLACFEIQVKLNPTGGLTPTLVRQKTGDRQIKIRGPFGTPLVNPERLIPRSPNQTWAYDKLLFIVGGSGLAAALHAVEWLFMPKFTPLLVIQEYVAANFDEIDLAEGDWVVTKEHMYDGWAFGLNLRTGKEGLFPLPVTYPRSGGATQMHILNSMHTADEAFGTDLLRGALLAHGAYVSVTHNLTRAIGSPESSRQMDTLSQLCPGEVEPASLTSRRGHLTVEMLRKALQQVGWLESQAPMRKVVVCGPQSFGANVYEMLVDQLNVEHEEILMLPPNTFV